MVNMAKKTHKKRQKARTKRVEPAGRPKTSCREGDTGGTVGRAVLETLKTADLYKLLVLKNLPGRSKVRKKPARVRVLAPLVTAADLAAIGVTVPPAILPPIVPERLAGAANRGARKCPRGRGARYEVPVAGIDVHRDVLWIATATPRGLGEELSFPNDAAGIAGLLQFCRFHAVDHVALESTAEYWLKVCWALRDAGVEVLVANPQQTKATQGLKTDPEDARRIALAFRDGRLKPSVPCTREQYERRKLVRAATKKTQQATAALNRLHALFHRFDAAEWITGLHDSQRGLRILQRSLEADDKSADALEGMLTEEYSRGPHQVRNPDVLRERAGELAGFMARLGESPEAALRYAHGLSEYVSFSQMAIELRTQALASVARDPALVEALELVLSLPSVGENLALTMLVEIVDVDYFARGKALARWAGLAPRVNQSGHRKRRTGRITKAGNKAMRRAAFIAAQVDYAACGQPGHPIGEFVRRLYLDVGKPYKVAVVAGARKLLTYLFRVLSERRPFAEIYAEEVHESVEKNYERKKRTLRRHLEVMPLADLLPPVVEALKGKCRQFSEAEAAFADQVVAILGRTPRVAGS